MTQLREIELDCPVCEHRFRSHKLASGNRYGGRRTDFYLTSMGVQPLAYEIHACDRCGFSGTERDFRGEADISPLLKDRVWGELAPRLGGTAVSASEKYEAAAKVAEWQGMEPRRIADLLLRAAWCCVDEGDSEAERFFRRKAVVMLERALASYDGISRDERAVVTYLVGELWRRIGDDAKARRWFDSVASEVTNDYEQQWIVDAARQQRDDPQEWFANE